ncbi:hypothetical protein HMPREF1557_00420 [Streptococcus sobrinus W1703]|uniref:Uncharacterized protein n=1 Tax=Streptococcus sobrinus W1703 TaxID=1227275 RepID=U2KLH2_9STRE|nr:hypothetical protein HMPREF1557_00420 [Streptococcus sobrinus W1703]
MGSSNLVSLDLPIYVGKYSLKSLAVKVLVSGGSQSREIPLFNRNSLSEFGGKFIMKLGEVA